VVIGANLGPARTEADINPSIDLTVALNKLHQLQLEDGDVGAQYWYQVSLLLKDAAGHRQRALSVEQNLNKIQALLKEKGVSAQAKLRRLRRSLKREVDLDQARSGKSAKGVNEK
jgi:hypothetical protein